jgi:hypothetical protein
MLLFRFLSDAISCLHKDTEYALAPLPHRPILLYEVFLLLWLPYCSAFDVVCEYFLLKTTAALNDAKETVTVFC